MSLRDILKLLIEIRYMAIMPEILLKRLDKAIKELREETGQ